MYDVMVMAGVVWFCPLGQKDLVVMNSPLRRPLHQLSAYISLFGTPPALAQAPILTTKDPDPRYSKHPPLPPSTHTIPALIGLSAHSHNQTQTQVIPRFSPLDGAGSPHWPEQIPGGSTTVPLSSLYGGRVPRQSHVILTLS